jgi:hypothetical protein
MSNQSGSIYGLTILSPIRDDPQADIPPSLAIQMYLAKLPRDHHSPFAKLSSTHMARLSVLEDVVRVTPVIEERLTTSYLVFESNFDGDIDAYLMRMASAVPEFVQAVWQHCVGYPLEGDEYSFITYMKKCQVETTFYFAAVNNKTVQETLLALRAQSSVAAFIERNQGKHGAELHRAFSEFRRLLSDSRR